MPLVAVGAPAKPGAEPPADGHQPTRWPCRR